MFDTFEDIFYDIPLGTFLAPLVLTMRLSFKIFNYILPKKCFD